MFIKHVNNKCSSPDKDVDLSQNNDLKKDKTQSGHKLNQNSNASQSEQMNKRPHSSFSIFTRTKLHLRHIESFIPL